MKIKFSDRYIKALQPKEKEYCIREGHGFTLRVYPSGVKSFEYIYTINGKRRRMALGVYTHVSLADARQKHRDAVDLLASGVDPQNPPELPQTPAILTVNQLAEKYFVHIETHLVKRSVRQQKRTIEADVLPVWGDRPITEIRRRDAVALIEQVARRAPGQARNVLLNARTMFSFAVHREMIEYNPFSGVGAAVPSTAPGEVDRVLTGDEIINVWWALTKKGSEIVRHAILLTLITGQRPGEVVGMHSSEIDTDFRWWTIPPERSKNGRENRVYLTNLARKLIPPLDGYCFPAQKKAKGHLSEGSLSHHITYYLDPPYLGLPRWTPHDLRRTAATKLAELGCSDEIIDEIQNHKKRGVIKTYNKYRYDKEKKIWLEKWSKYLEELTVKPRVLLRSERVKKRKLEKLRVRATIKLRRGEVPPRLAQ